MTWTPESPDPQPQEVFTSRFQLENVPAGGDPSAGAPILYYLANAAPRDTDSNATIDSWDIYDYADNYLITDPAPTTPTLAPDAVALANRKRHPLYAPSDGKTARNTPWNLSLAVDPLPAYFGITRPFTKDPVGTADVVYPTVPYNANTFILISPGPDGRYFTADDISNFK